MHNKPSGRYKKKGNQLRIVIAKRLNSKGERFDVWNYKWMIQGWTSSCDGSFLGRIIVAACFTVMGLRCIDKFIELGSVAVKIVADRLCLRATKTFRSIWKNC